MARAMRPLPSSNGCKVTNHRWPRPARISAGSRGGPLTRQAGLIAQGHADIGQPPHQQALGQTDLGHGLNQRSQIVAPVWPVTGLPDMDAIPAIHAEIMDLIHRKPDRLYTGRLGASALPDATRTGRSQP